MVHGRNKMEHLRNNHAAERACLVKRSATCTGTRCVLAGLQAMGVVRRQVSAQNAQIAPAQ